MAKLTPHSVSSISQLHPYGDVEQETTNIYSANIVHNSFHDQSKPSIKLLVFVDTGLFATHHPTRTLGVMEQERWIDLPSELSLQPYEEQIRQVQQMIVEHYQNNRRGLPLWGDIQRYCLWQIIQSENLEQKSIKKIWFDIQGKVTYPDV